MNTTSLPPRILSAERPRPEAAEAMAGSGMPEPPLLAEEVFSAVLEKTLQGDKAIATIEDRVWRESEEVGVAISPSDVLLLDDSGRRLR